MPGHVYIHQLDMIFITYTMLNYIYIYTLVNNEMAVDVQYKKQSNKESVENPIYAGRACKHVM